VAENEPNLVDYLTLAAAVVGPLAGVYATLWTVRRTEKVRFDAHIDWVDFGPNSPLGETPALYIHNKSKDALVVTEIRFRSGAWIKRRRAGTALHYEDPMDLDFPYTVQPGVVRRLILAEYYARKYADLERWGAKAADWLRRPTLWLEIVTATGRSKTIGAEQALTWKDRPRWAKIEHED
jgi:hypothetical protein